MSVRATATDVWNSYADFSLAEQLAQRRDSKQVETSLVKRLTGWLKPKRLLISVGILVLLVLLFFFLLFTGSVGVFYDWLTAWSSAGRPWTLIMRDHPWIFWVTAPLVLGILFFVVPAMPLVGCGWLLQPSSSGSSAVTSCGSRSNSQLPFSMVFCCCFGLLHLKRLPDLQELLSVVFDQLDAARKA
jgi:hypothetical protein